jgi:hypothetical protein
MSKAYRLELLNPHTLDHFHLRSNFKYRYLYQVNILMTNYNHILHLRIVRLSIVLINDNDISA